MKFSARLLVAFFALVVGLSFPHRAYTDAGDRPAVLICAARGAWAGHVDLDWLKDVRAAGFEPDYLDEFGDFTWERVQKYHCLVLYGCPAEGPKKAFPFPEQGPRLKAYQETIERFLEAGGGVFMMVETANADQHVRPLIEPWGARLPFETYEESDASKIADLPRMRGQARLVRVDGMLPSPITKGVENLWLPYGDRYNTSWTAPISVSKDWQVAVRGSKTSRSKPVDPTKTGYGKPAPPQALVRPGGVNEPDLIAHREYKNGRIVLLCQGPVFSIGQGTQWLYNRHSLSKGLDDIPSDFERLILNAFRWLSQPSLRSGRVRGYETADQRLLPPNLQPGVKEEFEKKFWSEEELGLHRPFSGGRLYRGLIGARSAFSIGRGTVGEYAAAAREAGLDFVAFLEDFTELTPEELKQLNETCRAHSGDDLLLVPGYTIDSNIGNHMFLTGYDLPWPRDDCLTGPRKQKMMIQFQDGQGQFVRGPNTYLQWVLEEVERYKGHMVGYYLFDDPRSMQVTDLKLSSAVGLKTYRDGELVDDRTADYPLSTAGTLPSFPVAVNLVTSPAELTAEAESGHALTYAQASSLEKLPLEALRWNSQYDGMNVFLSDGPLIQAWPECYRGYSYGAEPFVVDFELMPSELHVTSDAGLKEIEVLNGEHQVRRFLPGGAKSFREMLYLPAHVQQNLVVVARDVRGGEAVSFARRCWKPGSMSIAFCGDHVNDCGRQYLARGMGIFQLHRYPLFPAGYTWDGGPKGVKPVMVLGECSPFVVSDLGEEGGKAFNNIPVLEFDDDQAIVVRSLQREVYDPAIPHINAWYTSGPKGPSKLIESVRRFTEFNRPLVGPNLTGWAAQSVRSGAVLANFSNTIRFKQDQILETLQLARSHWMENVPVILSVQDAGAHRSYYLGDGGRGFDVPVPSGKWFGFYAKEPYNQVLFINRGDPLMLRIRGSGKESFFVSLHLDVEGRSVKAGQELRCEVFSVNESLDVPDTGPKRFRRVLDYLKEPEGIKIIRGQRVQTPGFFEVDAGSGHEPVELRIPRPAERIGLTVPVRITGLNPKWSAGLFQIEGHTTGFYTDGKEVYTTLGFDFDGRVYAALYPDHSHATQVVVGHPIVCDHPELILEVMPRTDESNRYQWHIAVNNPTDESVTTVFRQSMELPGLSFIEQEHRVPAGGYVVLSAM